MHCLRRWPDLPDPPGLARLMSRRTFHRAGEAERRRDLIAAALECVAESGVQGATVRQIAARAGVTGGLIRHYFQSKDEVLRAAYRSLMESMTEIAVAAAAEAGEEPRARLRGYITSAFTRSVAESRHLSIWSSFIGHVPVDPEFGAIHRENYLAYMKALEALIMDLPPVGDRKPQAGESRRLAIAVNGIIDGLWLEASMAGDLFAEGELAEVALSSTEAILSLPKGYLSEI